MERWQNRVAVVTGASSGIGAAITLDLAKAGLVVVGLARRVQQVEELKNVLTVDQRNRFHAIECDVSSEKSVNSAFEWIVKTLGGVDILVNNAGMAVPGKLPTMDVSQIRKVIDTNIMGVIQCTQHAFKSMKERNFNGHIIIVNSVLGHAIPAMPPKVEMNIYPATKFALTALTELYRQELKGLGTDIKITSISPGLVDTDIIAQNVRNLFRNSILQPKDISDGVLYVISTPPHVQVHELIIKPMGRNPDNKKTLRASL